MSETQKLPRLRPWHWWTGLGVLVVALIASVWWQRQPPPEPMYQGVPLSALLQGKPAPDGRSVTSIVRNEMGTEAVLYLTWALEHGKHERDDNSFFMVEWIREKLLRQPAYVGDDRITAAIALGEMGPAAVAAVPTLARVRPHENVEFRVAVATALCGMGSEAWPQIVALLEKGPEDTLLTVLYCLKDHMIAPSDPRSSTRNDAIAGYALQFSRHHDLEIRAAATALLGDAVEQISAGPRRREIIDRLIELLDDPNPLVQLYATYPLEGLGDEAAPAIPKLITLLDVDEPNLRAHAACALGNLDRVQRQSASRLAELTNDVMPIVRGCAKEALLSMGIKPPSWE